MTRRRFTGVTLIELVVVMALMGLMAAAVTSAFVAGLDRQRVQAQRQSAQAQTSAIERQITQLIEGAKLSSDTTDRTTFFVGANAADSAPPGLNGSGGASTTPQTSQPTSPSGNIASGSASDLGCDRLTFTTTAKATPMQARGNSDDFETQQQTQGPIGGVAEVSLSTTPVGDAGDRTGLFERIQRPSDGDYTQGGMESVLDQQVDSIGFQFWNGTDWVTSWDTVNSGTRRLPAAVQVSYILRGDPQNTVHRFLVPIPTSDVTAQNPVSTATSVGGGT